MQLGLLGMLLGLPTGAPAGNQQGAGGQPGTGDMFAQWLGDPGQGGGQHAATGGGHRPADVPRSALAAQEVGASHAADLAALSDLLAQEISAGDAAALLEQFDQAGAALGDGAADALLQQVKQSLEQIRDTKTPQTVGALLAHLPALKDAPAERAPVVERMLAWMKDALSPASSPEAPSQELDVAVDDGMEPARSPLMQSLQASMFRDADPAAPETAETAEAARDYIEILPLNVTVAQAPAWVARLTENSATAAPAAALPPQPADEGALPALELPRMDDGKVTDLAQFRAMVAENQDARKATLPAAAEAAPEAAAIEGERPGVEAAHATERHTPATPAAELRAHAPQRAINHAPVSEQVHVAIRRASGDGIDQLTLQLEPAELGRVEVRMQTDTNGQTRLTFLVDKPETLDALARDARHLERALQDAGLKTDSGGMQFNLRQQQGDGSSGGGQPHGGGRGGEGGEAAAVQPAEEQRYSITLRDGVDIRA